MRKLIVITGLLFVICSLVLVSCAGAPSEKVAPSVEVETSAPMPPQQGRDEAYSGNYKDGAGVLPLVGEERMIVRNGDMSLIVNDVVDTRDEIAQLAERQSGYVVSSWISGEEAEMRGSISIRVTDDKFEQTMAELRNLAIRVDSESTSSRDVTEEYIDLEARLKNAEATENQYLALMDKAVDVEDMLKIQDYLSRVRREIEQIKGQMTYLERTSSTSLITVQLQPATTAKPLVATGWNILEALKSAVRGLVIFGQWLATGAIWLLFLLPLWGTIVGIFYWRRRRKKKAY